MFQACNFFNFSPLKLFPLKLSRKASRASARFSTSFAIIHATPGKVRIIVSAFNDTLQQAFLTFVPFSYRLLQHIKKLLDCMRSSLYPSQEGGAKYKKIHVQSTAIQSKLHFNDQQQTTTFSFSF